MKWFLSVTFSVLIVASLADQCNISKGTMMVMDVAAALKSPPTGDIISFNEYQKNKYFAGLILTADVTHLCKAFVEKFDDLEMFSFNDVPIESFDDKLFDGAKSIENLEFDAAAVTHVKSGIFKNMENLEELKFLNTPIEKIDNGAFENLPKLDDFGITHSKLDKINPAWFSSCPSIVSVDFTGNKLRTIHAGDFAFMKPGVAHKIKLSDNKIKIIEANAFNSKSFDILDLEKNRLRTLGNAMFTKLRKSEEINLSNNRFSCIDKNTLNVLKLFNKIILDDNSVEEDCDKSHIISQLKNVVWNE